MAAANDATIAAVKAHVAAYKPPAAAAAAAAGGPRTSSAFIVKTAAATAVEPGHATGATFPDCLPRRYTTFMPHNGYGPAQHERHQVKWHLTTTERDH